MARLETRFAMITADRKQEIIAQSRTHDGDTGSPEVQVSILTDRIATLTEHLRSNRHDYASQRGLLDMVSKRRGLLKYLRATDYSRYESLITRLGLRH